MLRSGCVHIETQKVKQKRVNEVIDECFKFIFDAFQDIVDQGELLNLVIMVPRSELDLQKMVRDRVIIRNNADSKEVSRL